MKIKESGLFKNKSIEHKTFLVIYLHISMIFCACKCVVLFRNNHFKGANLDIE